ncbi:hypothetical protein PQ472_08520 [Lacticaseibacillus pabuli]|uniref:Mga helix-turn-helix domain-containing protein n=1 Tax=Lacticaseibacillus pabuli TaxID=3025672 RepID=A0ABY7WQB7_9LACO|nr:hypothetical protein [Lacticaseibacillus sp. KACC 23028]WDF81964.1 hypothetical protein PQ472_08520 [Lacticaseibacillus sp. KACC 23028]
MDYQMLLTDDDERISAILNQLVVAHSHMLPLTDLIAATQLSPYKIRKLINTTNDDLQKLQSCTRVTLSETKPTQVQLINPGPSLMPQMALNLLARSPLFVVFEYRFFYNNVQPKSEYMRAHFLSQTPFYHYEALLQQRIDADQGSLDDLPNAHVEPEYATRIQLFQIYLHAYQGVKSPFPELDASTAQITAILNRVLDVSPSPSKQNLLNVFLKVWQKRLRNQDYLQTSLLKPGEISAKMLSQLAPIIDLATADSAPRELHTNVELEYMLTLLSLLEVIPQIETMLAQPYQEDAERMTDAFLNQAKQLQLHAGTGTIDLGKLRGALMLINVKFLILHLTPMSFNTSVGRDFFERAYPAFDLLILKFIPELRSKLHYAVSTSDESVLYHNYMFALITSCPEMAINATIHICVDFTQGHVFTQYLAQMIRTFANAKIVIDTSVTPETNIYLSDTPSITVKCTQVIWKHSPSVTDWSHLIQQMIPIVEKQLLTRH